MNNKMTKQNAAAGNSIHFQAGVYNWISGTGRLLVFTPYAASRLFSYIGWRRDDFPENRKEQGGLLIGRYIRNPEGRPVQAEVVEVLLAQTECRYPGYIEWDGMEEIRLQRLFFDIKDSMAASDPAAAEELEIIGWWHTHPNDLNVFMSLTDMETQAVKCSRPEKYSVVLNPHKGIWRAFAGKNAEEVPAVMLIGEPAGNTEKSDTVDDQNDHPEKEDLGLPENSKRKKKGRKQKKRMKKGER